MQICYNLLSYRHEGFTGRYATRKFDPAAASRVAQASEDEQHLRSSPRRFRAKKSLLAVYSDDIDHICFQAFFTVVCANSQFVYNKKNVTGTQTLKQNFAQKPNTSGPGTYFFSEKHANIH